MSNENRFAAALNAPLSAKQFVLLLFGALDDPALPISKLIIGAELFGIEKSAVRVAVNRLMKDNVLKSTERGSYTIGESGMALYEASRGWQSMYDKVLDWDGSWFCVSTAHLGRIDRKALRARDRALGLRGFAALEDEFWIRPANLSLKVSELANDLAELGLSNKAIVLRTDELVHHSETRISALWDREELEAGYRAALAALQNSGAELHQLRLEHAAKEVLHIGAAVVSILTHDPLLPEDLVDARLRSEVVAAMNRYDLHGKKLWPALFASRYEGAVRAA